MGIIVLVNENLSLYSFDNEDTRLFTKKALKKKTPVPLPTMEENLDISLKQAISLMQHQIKKYTARTKESFFITHSSKRFLSENLIKTIGDLFICVIP